MRRLNSALALTAATLGGGAALSDVVSGRVTGPNTTQLAAEIESGSDHISAIDLAECIMKGDRNLSVYDLRSVASFQQFHIAGARNATVTEMATLPVNRNSTVVLYSEGGAHAGQAWVLLRMRGYRNVLFLREGIYEWMSQVVEPRLASDANEAERRAFLRAAEASRYFGGTPLSGVPRSEVPEGYWTGTSPDAGMPPATRQPNTIPQRRRGC